jgi:ubiquinone/menaquinone biosynthesis C-methylase UbiE
VSAYGGVALPALGPSGAVIGADISVPMLEAATARFSGQRFVAVTSDGQSLRFRDGVFDSVICQLGLMFFPDPARGLDEFRRVLKPDHRAAVCVISTAERAPIWGPSPRPSADSFPTSATSCTCRLRSPIRHASNGCS